MISVNFKEQASLIVISGPSGVGKGTIASGLLQRNGNMCFSVSATTRAMREGEAEGVNYYYKTVEEFEKMIENGEFLEYERVFGKNYYGTPKAFVEKKLSEGVSVLLDIDVKGAMFVKKNFPEAKTFFIAPPSLSELYRRLVNRGTETVEAVNERFAQVKKELEYIEKYDYAVVNDDLSLAIENIESILKTAKFGLAGYKRHLFNALTSE